MVLLLSLEESPSVRPEGVVCLMMLAVLLWLSLPLVSALSPNGRNTLAAPRTSVGFRMPARDRVPRHGEPISVSARGLASALVLSLGTARWQAR